MDTLEIEAATGRTPYENRLIKLLRSVAMQDIPVEAAVSALRDLPFSDLGFAKVDHHRELRQGTCEIVYGRGKSPSALGAIVESLIDHNDGPILVTRTDAEQTLLLSSLAERRALEALADSESRSFAFLRNVPAPRGKVLILTAGTSDTPIAQEAAVAARLVGTLVQVEVDVGVAGLHRLAAIRVPASEANAIVVVAGMEGALASVVGGLVRCPVIACPTSVGYGANFGGLAALLSMLSSCVPGVVCVNIDDGLGAGYTAALIARSATGRPN
mgnify:CR=1 FL=1